MTKRESIEKCINERQNTHIARVAAYEDAVSRLAEENKRFAEIKSIMSAIGAKLAITALSGNQNQLNEYKRSLCALEEERRKILSDNGISDVEYTCEKCRDTGYIDGKVCECIKEQARKLVIRELEKSVPIFESNFGNFSLDYYPDIETENGNPKKRMTEILKLCREYAIHFDPEKSESLLFMGNTGLGKTYMSLAIAYELILKGFNVIYGSAYNLFAAMEAEHFGEHTDKNYRDAVECDLLIIDDLGGEFVSPYIQSLVYNIINTRLLARKPTLINTNLSMSEINRVYTPRVASRLLGEYTAKRFLGSDIRQQKSTKK